MAIRERFDGPKLREIRDAQRLTQKEIGRACGVDAQTVGKWERGERSPGRPRLRALAEYLQVDPDSLLLPIDTTDKAVGLLHEWRTETNPDLPDSEWTEPGVRDLLRNKALDRSLRIAPEERRALAALDLRPCGRRIATASDAVTWLMWLRGLAARDQGQASARHEHETRDRSPHNLIDAPGDG